MSETPPQNPIANLVENFLENVVYPSAQNTVTQRAAFANAFNRLLIHGFPHSPIQSSNTMNNVLEQSFYDDTSVKKIASPQGLSVLKDISYNSTDVMNGDCPITFQSFNNETTVCVMPCKHGFNKIGRAHV